MAKTGGVFALINSVAHVLCSLYRTGKKCDRVGFEPRRCLIVASRERLHAASKRPLGTLSEAGRKAHVSGKPESAETEAAREFPNSDLIDELI